MCVIRKLDSLTRDSHLDDSMNQKQRALSQEEVQREANTRLSSGKTDFTEVKPDRGGYKYLLVFIDPFPGG